MSNLFDLLPNEVLERLLSIGCDGDGVFITTRSRPRRKWEFAANASCVCRRWRNIVNAPVNEFKFFYTLLNLYIISHNGICEDVALFKSTLADAGKSALFVNITDDHTGLGRAPYTSLRITLHCIRLLRFSAPYIYRLFVSFPNTDTIDILWGYFVILSSFELSRLITFQLNITRSLSTISLDSAVPCTDHGERWFGLIQGKFRGESSSTLPLRLPHLSNLKLPTTILSKFRGMEVVSSLNLTELSFGEFNSIDKVEWKDLYAFVKQQRSLRKLSLHGTRILQDEKWMMSSEINSLDLPFLESLIWGLEAWPFLCFFEFRCLHSLVLCQITARKDTKIKIPPAVPLLLSTVRKINIDLPSQSTDIYIPFLMNTHIPNCQSLVVHGHSPISNVWRLGGPGAFDLDPEETTVLELEKERTQIYQWPKLSTLTCRFDKLFTLLREIPLERQIRRLELRGGFHLATSSSSHSFNHLSLPALKEFVCTDCSQNILSILAIWFHTPNLESLIISRVYQTTDVNSTDNLSPPESKDLISTMKHLTAPVHALSSSVGHAFSRFPNLISLDYMVEDLRSDSMDQSIKSVTVSLFYLCDSSPSDESDPLTISPGHESFIPPLPKLEALNIRAHIPHAVESQNRDEWPDRLTRLLRSVAEHRRQLGVPLQKAMMMGISPWEALPVWERVVVKDREIVE